MKPTPTPRQLEAFCEVARHESMADAARACGHDLSTLSKHLSDLSALLGTRLYERDREGFRLTRHGRRLYEALERGREQRDAALAEIAADVRPVLQFVAAEVVTQHYLPGITRELERQHPDAHCSTESGGEAHLRRMLRDDEVNLAIAPDHAEWNGFSRAPLIQLPLVLICPETSPVRSAAELWAREHVTDVLYVSAAADTVTRNFDAGLRGLKVTWTNRRRVGSALCVTQHVADGDGFGVTVNVPNLVRRRGLRVLPLPNFTPLPLAAFWPGEATPLHVTAVKLLRKVASELQRAA